MIDLGNICLRLGPGPADDQAARDLASDVRRFTFSDLLLEKRGSQNGKYGRAKEHT
ncbi:MAG: Uncharacterised protein [Gammaproteobacteria bacterium]|nr:MAG: Uncharacterised protein [Gammaproteobacteria bacterium]